MRKFVKTKRPNSPERKPQIIDFQDEFIQMYVMLEGVEEGWKNKGGGILKGVLKRWSGGNQTSSIMSRLRQNTNSAFFICYHYVYRIVNVETKLKMVCYKDHRGSPWMNNFAEAERWLNNQESVRLNIDNIKRPNTKWVFMKFSNIAVKVVFDRQLLLGTGPLPDWLCNLDRGHAGPMVAPDNFADNLCLWRCIAVYQGPRLEHTGCKRISKELL